METFESLKNKLTIAVQASSDRALLEKLWNFYLSERDKTIICEPEVAYESEKPMNDEEVNEYFREEKIVLPPEILAILKESETPIERGEYYTNEEVQKYFDVWLKN